MSILDSQQPKARFAGLLRSMTNITLVRDMLIDLVFPPRCGGCSRVDYHWCPRCAAELAEIPLAIEQRELELGFMVAGTAIHEGLLQSAIHGLKYDNVRGLADPLGDRLVAALKVLGWEIDLVVPVPLGAARLAARGYNQAGVIAARMAAVTGYDAAQNGLYRIRETRTQVGLNRSERLENVSEAFSADPQQVRGRRALIVDDVLTTGATLLSCAIALQTAGAQTTYGLTATTAKL